MCISCRIKRLKMLKYSLDILCYNEIKLELNSCNRK